MLTYNDNTQLFQVIIVSCLCHTTLALTIWVTEMIHTHIGRKLWFRDVQWSRPMGSLPASTPIEKHLGHCIWLLSNNPPGSSSGGVCRFTIHQGLNKTVYMASQCQSTRVQPRQPTWLLSANPPGFIPDNLHGFSVPSHQGSVQAVYMASQCQATRVQSR